MNQAVGGVVVMQGIGDHVDINPVSVRGYHPSASVRVRERDPAEVVGKILEAEQAPIWNNREASLTICGGLEIVSYGNFIGYFPEKSDREDIVSVFREDVGKTRGVFTPCY